MLPAPACAPRSHIGERRGARSWHLAAGFGYAEWQEPAFCLNILGGSYDRERGDGWTASIGGGLHREYGSVALSTGVRLQTLELEHVAATVNVGFALVL